MKSNNTVVLASLIVALATAFSPHRAFADTSTSTTASDLRRPTGDAPIRFQVITTVIDIVTGVL